MLLIFLLFFFSFQSITERFPRVQHRKRLIVERYHLRSQEPGLSLTSIHPFFLFFNLQQEQEEASSLWQLILQKQQRVEACKPSIPSKTSLEEHLFTSQSLSIFFSLLPFFMTAAAEKPRAAMAGTATRAGY